jgi:hypothetical protein
MKLYRITAEYQIQVGEQPIQNFKKRFYTISISTYEALDKFSKKGFVQSPDYIIKNMNVDVEEIPFNPITNSLSSFID